MIRVVIDTNVVVSSQLVDEGQPAAIMDLAFAGKIRMIISPEVFAEYEEVLHRPRFRFDTKLVDATLDDIRAMSTMVSPKRQARKATDEKDNRFLAAAAAGNADFIITGNTRHFPKRYRKTNIVTPSEFIAFIGPVFGLPRTH